MRGLAKLGPVTVVGVVNHQLDRASAEGCDLVFGQFPAYVVHRSGDLFPGELLLVILVDDRLSVVDTSKPNRSGVVRPRWARGREETGTWCAGTVTGGP